MKKFTDLERGFSLVEIMIAGVVIVVILMGMASMMSQFAKQKIGTNVSMDAQMLRQNVMQYLQNDVSWLATLADQSNKSLRCVREVSDCSDSKEFAPAQWLKLFDPSGKIIQDTSLPMAGFSESGRPCGTFPSAACPFRVDVLWRAMCGKEPPCLLPQLEVQAKVIRNTGKSAASANIPFNPENYVVRLYRPTAVLGLNAPSPSPSANPEVNGSSENILSMTDSARPTTAPTQVTLPVTPAVKEQVTKFTKELCSAVGDAASQPGFAEDLKQRFESMGLGPQESEFFAKSFQTNCQQSK